MWWNDSIDAATLSWASITPFGVPVVPLVKMSWNTSSGSGRFQAAWRASQSGGKSGSSVAGSAESASTVVVGKSARPAVAGSGASRPVPRIRWRAPDARTMVATASIDIRRSSGTITSRACIAPKYAAGRSGLDGLHVRIRSPGSRSSARSRQAAIRARRSRSRYDQCAPEPSSDRRPSAGRSPKRVTARSSRSIRVIGTNGFLGRVVECYDDAIVAIT